MDDFSAAAYALTEGLRELPTDDVARVQNFLAEYLGSTQHPVPFGGRAKDFARLDAWLAEKEAPPYTLLVAPAGRGKSALLLRWCQQLLGRPELAVVYFPVSIRFRTNLAGVVFPALVALLARLHGESLPGDPHIQEEVWRGLLHNYLARPLPDGRLLILVLDGVDEAADWTAGSDLLPTEPPPGLRVVISARYLANDQDASAWLRRLAWTRQGLAHTLELFPLDRAGIASVLLQMGFPVDLLSARVDIVSELHRLSEGDPLLIRLYVDDLWERGAALVRLQPGDLRAIRPGLVGYFERWWNDQRLLWSSEAPQREVAVQSVLNLLVGALGPLSQRDMLALAPREVGLNSANLEGQLEPLARFVIGDGMHQGYVFSHPRLASYFLEERLNAQERQEVERRFLAWGAETLNALNQGRLAPEQASAYIVQYYGAHLERAGASPEALLALVSDGWRQAWEKLDRAHAGFLGDVERAERVAVRANTAATEAGQCAPYLGAEIRSLLCRASINSMTSNISPRLMLEAVRGGVWTPAQGLASIRLISDPLPRARELVGLAPSVHEPLRTDILQEALDTLMSLPDERVRFDAIVELAPGFSATLLTQLLTEVSAIEDEADRAGMLADLAASLASYPRLIEQALDMTQEFEEDEYLALALAGLAPYLSSEQDEAALHLARGIQDERFRAQALIALVPYLPERLLQEVLPDAYRLWDTLSQARLLADLACLLPDRSRDEPLRETLKLLGEIIDQEYRVELLLRLVPSLPEEHLLQALHEIQALWDESQRTHALCELLPFWPEKYMDKFLQGVQAMKHEEQVTTILRQLLPRLPQRLLPDALASIQTIWDEGRRAELLALLAPSAGAEVLPRLIELIQAIGDPGYRVWLLAEMEAALAGKFPALPFDIAQTFESMGDAEERLQTLLAIVPRLSEEALAKLFRFMLPEVFDFRWSVQSIARQAQILSKLGPRLPTDWLSRAMHRIRLIDNDLYQVQALVALAPRLPEELLPSVLEIARTMQEREKRAQVLEALVAVLPEESRGKRVREMLQVLQVIKDERERSAMVTAYLNALSTTLSEQQAQLILTAAQAMRSEIHQANILAALAAHASEQILAELLHIIQHMRSEEEKAQVLKALAPHLPADQLSLFLEVVRSIQHTRWRAPVLASIAPYVSQAGFTQVLSLVYQAREEDKRVQLLSALIPQTSEEAFSQLWPAIQRIKTSRWRSWLLGSLTHVPEALFSQVWQAIQAIENDGWRIRALSALARALPEDRFERLWHNVQEIENAQQRQHAISAIASYVPEYLFPQVLQEALDLANLEVTTEGKWQSIAGNALEALASRVPESLFPHYWQAVDKIQDRWCRARLQTRLASHVPEACFAQVWQTMNGLEDQWQQTDILEALAARVPEYFFPHYWQAVEALEYPAKQFNIVKKLLPRLSADQLDAILDLARSFNQLAQKELLRVMLPHFSEEQSIRLLDSLLPPPEQQGAGEEAKERVWHNEERVYYLGELALYLPEERFLALLPGLLEASRLTQRDGERARLLARLAPRAPEEALPKIMEVLWQIEMPQTRQEVLDVLLPTLTLDGWGKVLRLASEQTRKTGNLPLLTQILRTASTLKQQPSPALLYPPLRDLLRLLTQETRRNVLDYLTLLANILSTVGGETALREACCASAETGYWWP